MFQENQEAGSRGESFSKPVFVVGVYRSGTSLLYALLNQHPQMALMYECDVWDFPNIFSKIRFKRDWLQRQEFYNKALSRHRLFFGGSLHGLENIRTPEDLYRTFGEVKNSKFFGEKSPFYCARLRQLARRYPECSFILLWRDPIEIYRSVVRASRKERFFRRRGVLSRLIYYQDQMIQQAAELDRAGVRVCHVTYAGLSGDTEKTCQKICGFLGIEFDEKMLDLANADLSAVYPGPEHNHLRRGKIERQQFDENAEIISPVVQRKLQRFDARWSRLQSPWLGDRANSSAGPEPSLMERLYQKVTGRFFCALDDGKRALFEFLPLTWLHTYRQTKRWVLEQRDELPADRRSYGEQFRAHWVTILASATILAFVAYLDIITGPDITLLPFYLIPCAALALVINQRWGTFAVATAMVVWSIIQIHQNPNLNLEHWQTLLWDAGMRFVILEIIVLLLNRVRVQAEPASGSA